MGGTTGLPPAGDGSGTVADISGLLARMRCEEHEDSEVIRYEKKIFIAGVPYQLALYGCKDCGEYNGLGFEDFIGQILGYECPTCGVVAGLPDNIYNHSQGAGFTSFECTKCGKDLGTLICD